jgi:hypothetical protein
MVVTLPISHHYIARTIAKKEPQKEPKKRTIAKKEPQKSKGNPSPSLKSKGI